MIEKGEVERREVSNGRVKGKDMMRGKREGRKGT